MDGGRHGESVFNGDTCALEFLVCIDVRRKPFLGGTVGFRRAKTFIQPDNRT